VALSRAAVVGWGHGHDIPAAESATRVTGAFRSEGSAVHGIDDLYRQLDALLMGDQGWTLGPSLDALHDVLHRFDDSGASFVWIDHVHSRATLGIDETRRWLQSKLDPAGPFGQARIRADLDGLEAGTGSTYFDRVLEVFAAHPTIGLELR
jgi:hypothetical protein